MDKAGKKAVDGRLWEAALGSGDLDVVDEIVAHDCVLADPVVYPYKGPAGIKEFFGAIRRAYPDAKVDLRDQLEAEGDRVVSRWELTGTGGGETPQEILIRATSTTRVSGGRIDRIRTHLIVEFRSSHEAASWWCRIVRCK